jgi:TonB family protein
MTDTRASAVAASVSRAPRILARLFLLVCFALAGQAFFATPSHSQTHISTERRVISRVDPEYPETLKRLFIGGIVRVETVVGPDGTVQNTKLLGGNPILGQAAIKAIKQWKYAPSGSKDTLVVRLDFNPHE